jgi:DNA-binding NtrC family response regulator
MGDSRKQKVVGIQSGKGPGTKRAAGSAGQEGAYRTGENLSWLLPQWLRYAVMDFITLLNVHYGDKAKSPPLMIVGDRGVGKSLFLHIFKVHYRDFHPAGKIVYLNAAAIPETLAESELFGYEAGAFSDAKRSKPGLVEEADLLILEEIGELPKYVQAKLLTFIENGIYYRLGATEPRPAKRNMQIIATTNRKEEDFRADFYDRFFKFLVPALHTRRIDVLCHLDAIDPDLLRSLNPCEILTLLAHNWPGNVREVERIAQELSWRRAKHAEDQFYSTLPVTPGALSSTQTRYKVFMGSDLKNSLQYHGVDVKLLERIFNEYGLGFDLANRERPFSKEDVKRQPTEEEVAFDRKYGTKSYMTGETMSEMDKGLFFVYPAFFLVQSDTDQNLLEAVPYREGQGSRAFPLDSPLAYIDNPGTAHRQLVRDILKYIFEENPDPNIPIPEKGADEYIKFIVQSTHGKSEDSFTGRKGSRKEPADITSMTEEELLATYYRQQREQATRSHGRDWMEEVSRRTGIKKDTLYKKYKRIKDGKKSTDSD